ncbi:unnamed protein product, partial [Phaeothamnion confervicola]
DAAAFAGAPLEPAGALQHVAATTRAQRGEPAVGAALPFDVSKHPAARSHVARTMLERTAEDVAWFAGAENAAARPCLAGLGPAEVAAIVA